ncbi:MAG: type II toxin-antitoxin system HicA family toxin [Bacteroidales bacterium]|nr:type II toxin-antitoxin system HicA family toxin [Bacteroidales bacterium]
MKYSEIHRMFIKSGWKFNHAEGSHYFYTKNGELSEPIPYHGSKEIPKGIAIKLIKRYELKQIEKGGH